MNVNLNTGAGKYHSQHMQTIFEAELIGNVVNVKKHTILIN